MADTEKPVPSPDGVGGIPLKKKRQMSPEHLAKLAEARKKANEIRLAKQAEKREQKELEKKVKNLEEKKRLKELKEKAQQLDVEEEALALPEVIQVKEEKPKGKVVEIGVTKEQQQELLEEAKMEKSIKKVQKKPRKKKVIYLSDSSSSDSEDEKVVYVRRNKGKKPKPVGSAYASANPVVNPVGSAYASQSIPTEQSMSNEILRRTYQNEVDKARLEEMKRFFMPPCNFRR